MTTPIVDGLGHIHAKVYASVGALPTPFLGALAIVDGGTGGQLYVALHDISGSLGWIAWTALYNAIVKNPSPNQNVINDTNSGEYALYAIGDFGIRADSNNGPSLVGIQTGTAPNDAVGRLERATLTPNAPVADVAAGDGVRWGWLNGYGEIAVKSYSPNLPAANTNHLGAIARLIAGGAGTDTFWLCALQGGTPTWLSFQGPIGPAGPTGPQGATPLFNAPAAVGLSAGSAPTIVQSGDGSVATPYHQVFGIPAGAQGAPGVFNGYPPLPAAGGTPIDFWLPCESGQYNIVPYVLPLNYTVQILESAGWWSAGDGTHTFETDWRGTNQLGFLNGLNYNQVVWRGTQLNNGILTSQDSAYSDPTASAYVVTTANTVMAIDNNQLPADSFGGILWVHIKIIPSDGTNQLTLYFNLNNYGFAPKMTDPHPMGLWDYGYGWGCWDNFGSPDVTEQLFITKQFAHTFHFTRIRVYTYNHSSGGRNGSWVFGTTAYGFDLGGNSWNTPANTNEQINDYTQNSDVPSPAYLSFTAQNNTADNPTVHGISKVILNWTTGGPPF